MSRKRLVLSGLGYIMRDKAMEILRLSEDGFSKTRISESVKVHRKTVRDYVSRAKASGIKSADIEGMTEEKYQLIFCTSSSGRKRKKAELSYEYLSTEIRRRGVTLLLLWEEYLSENSQGCGYSTFCDRYLQWSKKHKLSMRISHKAGEKCFVDYSGMTFPIYNGDKPDEILYQAEVFVGALGASNYTYLEASESQKLINWIGSHVRMFEYFGGVPKVVVPDNLKSAVNKACIYDPETNQSYRELACHYNLAIVPTRVAKPKDKAKVEKAVQETQRWLLAPLRDEHFYSIAELNLALWRLLEGYHQKLMQLINRSRFEVFKIEEQGN